MFGKKDSVPAFDAQGIDTVISQHCVIEGNIRTQKSLKLDGRIEGNVLADGLVIIGPQGAIQGDVHSGQLLVLGELHGNVKATHLHLQASARISGNIDTQTLQVDPGAQYHGAVSMHGAEGAQAAGAAALAVVPGAKAA